MKSLIITANPSSKWFTHKIAYKLKNILEKRWESVEIMDLYSPTYKQDFLTFEDKSELWKLSETTKLIQNKISEVDEIVFVFPIWNQGCPAILKNFIDCNFTAWFAFKFEKWWKHIKLLEWKTFRIFATSWAPAFVYEKLIPLKDLWEKRMDFFGLNLVWYTIFWDIDRIDTDKQQYLDDLEKLV